MRISPINYNHNIYNRYKAPQNVNFGYSFEEYKNEKGEVINRNTTCFCRYDLEQNKIPQLFEETFKGDDKVNVIVYGCSTGEEPMSVLMSLHSKLGDKALAKYAPIQAKDIRPDNIEKAKNVSPLAMFDELYFLQKEFPDYKNYFYMTPLTTKCRLTPKPILKDNIKFSVADITNDIKNIPNKRVALFCRNFWPYLNYEQQEKLLSTLSKKLNDNQHLLFVGEFDLKDENGISRERLHKYGFYETDKYVFKKQ